MPESLATLDLLQVSPPGVGGGLPPGGRRIRNVPSADGCTLAAFPLPPHIAPSLPAPSRIVPPLIFPGWLFCWVGFCAACGLVSPVLLPWLGVVIVLTFFSLPLLCSLGVVVAGGFCSWPWLVSRGCSVSDLAQLVVSFGVVLPSSSSSGGSTLVALSSALIWESGTPLRSSVT